VLTGCDPVVPGGERDGSRDMMSDMLGVGEAALESGPDADGEL
jgi:hypothetical protein